MAGSEEKMEKMERWEEIANQMLGQELLATQSWTVLKDELKEIDEACNRAGGRLISRQVIASVVVRHLRKQ